MLLRLDRHGNAKGTGIKAPNSETNALLYFAVSYGTSFLSKIWSLCLTLHVCLEYSASSKLNRHTLCHKVTILSNKWKQKNKYDITTLISKIQHHLYMWKYWTKFVHDLVFPPVHISSSSGGVESSVISLTFGILFYFLVWALHLQVFQLIKDGSLPFASLKMFFICHLNFVNECCTYFQERLVWLLALLTTVYTDKLFRFKLSDFFMVFFNIEVSRNPSYNKLKNSVYLAASYHPSNLNYFP